MEGAARADLGQSLTLLVAEVAAEQQLQLDGGDFPLSRIAGEARLDPAEGPALAFGVQGNSWRDYAQGLKQILRKPD